MFHRTFFALNSTNDHLFFFLVEFQNYYYNIFTLKDSKILISFQNSKKQILNIIYILSSNFKNVLISNNDISNMI